MEKEKEESTGERKGKEGERKGERKGGRRKTKEQWGGGEDVNQLTPATPLVQATGEDCVHLDPSQSFSPP